MDLRALGMGLAFALMWSSAFTSARMIVTAAPPLTSLALRFLISGLLAVAIARALGQNWHLTRAQWRATAVFGLCQNAIYLGLNFIAMQQVQASLAAIIASAMPLMVAAARWSMGERLPLQGALGLFAGVAGVALIMGARISGGVDPGGLALCLVAVVSLAVATLSMGRASSGGNMLMIVGLQMLVGAAAICPFALGFERWQVDWSPQLVLAFWYTVLVPGIGATLVWFLLVARIGATRAATFHFLNPFLGVLVAALLLGERLSLWDAIGVAVIAGGILAVQLARAHRTV